MTQLLSEAFEQASRLPPGEQQALAAILLQEMESERKWEALFARPESQDLLERLSGGALEGRRLGRNRKLDSNQP